MLQRATDPWSHGDADTHEKTALLLLGEERGRGSERGEDGEKRRTRMKNKGVRRLEGETVGRRGKRGMEVRRNVAHGWRAPVD